LAGTHAGPAYRDRFWVEALCCQSGEAVKGDESAGTSKVGASPFVSMRAVGLSHMLTGWHMHGRGWSETSTRMSKIKNAPLVAIGNAKRFKMSIDQID
jgi:hypothetical protein